VQRAQAELRAGATPFLYRRAERKEPIEGGGIKLNFSTPVKAPAPAAAAAARAGVDGLAEPFGALSIGVDIGGERKVPAGVKPTEDGPLSSAVPTTRR